MKKCMPPPVMYNFEFVLHNFTTALFITIYDIIIYYVLQHDFTFLFMSCKETCNYEQWCKFV